MSNYFIYFSRNPIH